MRATLPGAMPLRATLRALAVALALSGCEGTGTPVGGASKAEVERGRLLLRQFGCGTCHRIPGVPAADGDVGPPLDAIARRVYLAGVVPNDPKSLARFIRDPRAFKPGTAMPDMGVGEAHAADMVAYLQTLR